MTVEQERKKIEKPKEVKEVWETLDGVPLKGGPLQKVLPGLFQGEGLPLEEVMKSQTSLGEAFRRTFAKIEKGIPAEKAMTVVVAIKKQAKK